LKRQIAAQARLATNQVRVNQPQNEVNAGPEVAGNANEQNLEGRVEIPLTPVQAMTAAAIADLNSGTKGLQVFQKIESSHLDPAQKQEVFLALAENIVSESCKNAQEGVGVLRDNTSGTQLMSSYMNAYASEYVDAVGQQMLEAIQNIPLPAEGYSRKGADATLTQDNVPKAGFMNDDEDKMSPELSKQWDDVYFQAGMAAIVAGETQLPKLSPEAQAFLKSCGDTVRKFTPAANADNAAIMVMANTVCLRAGFQTSASDGSALQMKGASVQDKIQGRLLTNASIIAQTYVNTLPKESELGNERPHHKIVNFLREQGLDESRSVMKNLSRGQLPNISPNELAPPDATQKINTAIPDREQRLLAAQGVELPATQATQGVQNTASAPPNVAAESDGAKARVARVGDVLRAASGIKNSVVNALEQKGAEQSLKKVQDKDSKLVQDYKELQNKMSDLKNQYLNAVDATKSLGRSDAEIQTIKDRIDETKKEMDDMKAANKGLAQLDRSKVGQVIHSSVRDAAKAVSNRLK
jgi:hypothetical protein